MTTEDIIIHLFCYVDDHLPATPKVGQASLYPSEVVTIGLLFCIKGGRFRAFYRWLKRDYDSLFSGLPDRTNLQRQLAKYQYLADALLAEPSALNVVDSYPIELLFPIRQGRSYQQLGKKNKDKGRWYIGIKLAWIINTYGRVVGWSWVTANRPDQDFNPLLATWEDEAIILSDLGFRCAEGTPANLKLCPKGTWNDRMTVETVFSMITVVWNAKKLYHRVASHLQARLAYFAAAFNTVLNVLQHLDTEKDAFTLSIAQFSL
jgi:hypothetical protein